MSLLLTALLLISISSVTSAESPYAWYTFNIPPFGSVSERGIGYVLANAYIDAGFKNKVTLVTPARWLNDMQNPKNTEFCTTGSWKLPDTDHRIYSDSILNTVDYGIAVRSKLYKALSKNGENRIVSIVDAIDASKSFGRLIMMDGRPIFGQMNTFLEEAKLDSTTNIGYVTASEGSVTMLRMANEENRDVAGVLLFPEEYQVFNKAYPGHKLEYLMLTEGNSFAPIRASCPDTVQGRKIVATINRMLTAGLRGEVFQLFLEALPDIQEIKKQASINQYCIKDSSCQDPLTNNH